MPTPLSGLGPLCAEPLAAQPATTAIERTSAHATLQRAIRKATFLPPCKHQAMVQPNAGTETLQMRSLREPVVVSDATARCLVIALVVLS